MHSSFYISTRGAWACTTDGLCSAARHLVLSWLITAAPDPGACCCTTTKEKEMAHEGLFRGSGKERGSAVDCGVRWSMGLCGDSVAVYWTGQFGRELGKENGIS